MPTRIWVWIGVLIGVPVAALLALTILAPQADAPPGSRDVATASGGAAARSDIPQPADAPVPATPGANEGQPALPDLAEAPRILTPEPPIDIAAPVPDDSDIQIEPGFQTALNAFADEQRALLPIEDSLTTLQAIDVTGRQIWFNYQINLDRDVYPFPIYQEPLLPALDAWACDGSVCFEFTEDFALEPCRSAVAPLIMRGAVAVYNYRDLTGQMLGRVFVTSEDCAP